MNEEDITYTRAFSKDQKERWWGKGEWVEEADFANFTYKGINCMVRRIFDDPNNLAEDEKLFNGCVPSYNSGGYLCGYIELPEGSIYSDKEYSDIPIECHHGLTFKEYNIIGYDCAHLGDYHPAIENLKKEISKELSSFNIFSKRLEDSIFIPVYRNMAYCIEQCKSMVDQLLDLTSHSPDLSP